MQPKNREPTGPGEFLNDLLEEAGMTQAALAAKTGLTIQTVNTLINGKRSLTAETALKLARAFEISPEFWMNAQSGLLLWRARQAAERRMTR